MSVRIVDHVNMPATGSRANPKIDSRPQKDRRLLSNNAEKKSRVRPDLSASFSDYRFRE